MVVESGSVLPGVGLAPIFHPTEEEFADPIEYINYVRENGGADAGIAKICPPPSWKPVFAVEKRKLRIRPREQNISLIDGFVRAEREFEIKVRKIMFALGAPLRMPEETLPVFYHNSGVNVRLSLLRLYRCFNSLDGCKTWVDIANKILAESAAYEYDKPYPSTLRAPSAMDESDAPSEVKKWFDLCQDAFTAISKKNEKGIWKRPNVSAPSENIYVGMSFYKYFEQYGTSIKGMIVSAPWNASDEVVSCVKTLVDSTVTESMGIGWRVREMQKVIGPGAKSLTRAQMINELEWIDEEERGGIDEISACKRALNLESDALRYPLDKRVDNAWCIRYDVRSFACSSNFFFEYEYEEQVQILVASGQSAQEAREAMGGICQICLRAHSTDTFLVCRECKCHCHASCARVDNQWDNESDWFCNVCMGSMCASAPHAKSEKGEDAVRGRERAAVKGRSKYGYGFTDVKEYMSYGAFQAAGKAFRAAHPQRKDTSTPLTLEAEYWTSVLESRQETKVLYGSDVDASRVGSGFASDFDSGWNLNKLPSIDGSLLHPLNDINGINVPWLYVGSQFSSFCWHNEDHYWSSINYNHWGAPKVWYGCPGSEADKFERVAKEIAPELFDEEENLLLGIVTQFLPSTLARRGLKVVFAQQNAGEFIVTFPKAFHGGYNAGLNCAEAVNFATTHWLPFARECVERYSSLKRTPIIAYDHFMHILSGTIASGKCSVDLVQVAKKLLPHLLDIVGREKALRKKIADRCAFGNAVYTKAAAPQQCVECRRYCQLSSCKHNGKVLCIEHAMKLGGKDVRFEVHVNMSELDSAVSRLKLFAEAEDVWREMARDILSKRAQAISHRDLAAAISKGRALMIKGSLIEGLETMQRTYTRLSNRVLKAVKSIKGRLPPPRGKHTAI